MIKKWLKAVCSAFCFLNIALLGTALATPLDERLDTSEERNEQASQDDHAIHLAFVSGNFDLQGVSMHPGEPVRSLLLYLGGPEGRVMTDAQVITTLIDASGGHYTCRATPYKCGYFADIAPLPAGRYRVEAEIIANAQLWTEEFVVDKG